jgi:hypothetical protein
MKIPKTNSVPLARAFKEGGSEVEQSDNVFKKTGQEEEGGTK